MIWMSGCKPNMHPVWLHCQGQEGRECIQWSGSQDATRGFELVRLLAVVWVGPLIFPFTIVLLFFSQWDIFNILITPMTLDWTRGADSLGAGPRLWRRNSVRWDRKTFVKDQSAESYSLPHLHFGDSFTHVMYCNRRASRLPRGRREAQARQTTWSPDQKPRMLGETYYYS